MAKVNLKLVSAASHIKQMMFLAGDSKGHSLAYGTVARGWMLENPEAGLIRVRPNLVAGLSDLERVSGVKACDFAITDNPYA